MNVKKEAIENVTKLLTNKQAEIKHKLRRNIFEMESLVRDQTILKREVAYYGSILKELRLLKKGIMMKNILTREKEKKL